MATMLKVSFLVRVCHRLSSVFSLVHIYRVSADPECVCVWGGGCVGGQGSRPF